MKIKRIVAYITAIVMLVLSCGIVTASEIKPTADIGVTVCDRAVLVGNYTYTGTVEQGESIYRWYKSDSIFDKGTVIEGANGQTLTADSSTAGKFLTFAVVPVDINGIIGDEVCADPVMQSPGYYEDFSGDTVTGLEIVETADGVGSVAVVNDPTGGSDKALKVYKNSTSSYKTEARLGFNKVSAEKSVVDVSLYASDIVGTARLFGVYSDTYGSVLELQTDESGKLYYRGGSGLKESAQSFPTNTWNRIVIEIDRENKTVKAEINGESIINGTGIESWRFENDGYNNVAVYFLNYGNGGSIFIKNFAVVNAASTITEAEADAADLDNIIPEDTELSINLPTSGRNGSYIYWKSSLPEYISDTGVVTRPDFGDGDKDVVLTAFVVNGSAIVKKEFTVSVWEGTEKPVAQHVQIIQNESRPIIASYKYFDAEGYKEEGTIYKWYVEENGVYELIDGLEGLIFVPSVEYNNKNLKFSVTPRNKFNVVGDETFSEPITYVYYETQNPVAQISSKKVNSDNAFEIEYSYTSPDYIDEAGTIIKWYISDTLLGEYTVINGAEELTYTPTDLDAYYKVSVTPVDAEDNIGDEVLSEPFMYAGEEIDTAACVQKAISALVIPESTNQNLVLPSTTEDGAYYTYVSSEPAVLTENGEITRSSKTEESKTVTLTAYAVCGFDIKTAEFTVVVDKLTEPPVITDVRLTQTSRPINIEYTYSDADENKEGNTIYEWYYKPDAQGEFVLIDDAHGNRYVPSSTMDGYIFIANVTPVDDSNTKGETYTTPEYTYIYQSPAAPSAVVGEINYSLSLLTGVYTYENADGIEEGSSEYKWYVSDSLLGQYEPIEGENNKYFVYLSKFDGKFVKFSVTPKDIEGVTGETVFSAPVLIEFGEVESFDETDVISNKLDTTGVLGGSTEIVADPADADNKVLALTRTSNTSGEKTRVIYPVPEHEGALGIIVEADIYPTTTLTGTWEMLHINNEVGNAGYKLYCGKANTDLFTRGGATYINGVWVEDSSSSVSNNFTKNTWHSIRVEIDYKNQMMVRASLDGTIVQENMPLRYKTSYIGSLSSYMQNATNGTVYMDNFIFTPIYDTTGKAEEDARAIELNANLDSVISNLRLPAEGTVNGSKIVWESSDETVIKASGKVYRPLSADGDKNVTLTAHVIKGNSYYKREFYVTVIRNLTDAEIVEYDLREIDKYNGLILGGDISLPEKGDYGATYTWHSADETVITNRGVVTIGNEKKDIEFEITIEKGTERCTKSIVMTVAPEYGNNLIIDGGLLASSAQANNPALYGNDSDYSTYWSSLSQDTTPFIIMDMGKSKKVNRLYFADKTKTLSSVTVSVSKDKHSWTNVNVMKNIVGDNINIVEFEDSDCRYVRAHINSSSDTAVINEVGLFYVESDSSLVAGGIDSISIPVSGTITSNFTVTTVLADGTPVQWTSSNSSVISFSASTAVVTRPRSDTSVTLTATVTRGGVSDKKMFVLVVKGTSAGNVSSNSPGGSGGGGVSAVGTTLPGVLNVVADVPIAGFTDIGDVPWASEAINKLSSNGVINGVSENSYEPMRNITREEFAAILQRGFGFDETDVSGDFNDVKPDNWYYQPVMQLSSMGIINGVGSGSFGTGTTISRQDMAVMIYRAAMHANVQFGEPGAEFSDDASIEDYAKAAVYALSGSGIVNGVGNESFNPKGNATRAEAAVILFRIINYLN